MRNMLGLEGLCRTFCDDPALIERMTEEHAESVIRITEEVMKHTKVDAFWYWEDMAHKHGPLVDDVPPFRLQALSHG